MPTLSNKVALITGGSRGFGLAIARQLAAEGATLALLARDAAALADVATELSAVTRVGVYPCDIADDTQLDSAHASAVRELGDIDILINNAAVQGPLGPFETLDWAEWKRVFDIDLFAAARLCRLVIPAMRRKAGGKIIGISGGGATGPRPDVTAYAAAKTALVRFMETLAEELKDAKIDVNTVAPGAMNTRMLEETLAAGPGGIRREYQSAVERAKAGGVPPEKAAEAVVFLASPASDGITGRLIASIWDDWASLPKHLEALGKSDVFTLRRITPKERGFDW